MESINNKNELSKSGIYKISNCIDNRIYIGSAVNFYNRMRSHKSCFKKQNHNVYFQNFVNKYGVDSLIFEIIEYVEDSKNLISREQYYIDLLQPFKSENGFNIQHKAGNVSYEPRTINEAPPKQPIRFYFDESTIAKIIHLPNKERSQVVENLLNGKIDELVQKFINEIIDKNGH